MGAPDEEYMALIKCAAGGGRGLALKALQAVAETNEHHAEALSRVLLRPVEDPQVKETQKALIKALIKHPYYYSILTNTTEDIYSGTSTKRPLEPTPTPPQKKVKTKNLSNTISDNTLTKPTKPTKPTNNPPVLLPFPPEYFLFKLVPRDVYIDSFKSLIRSSEVIQQKEPISLTRSYLISPGVDTLAQRLLYGSPLQCKACGLRLINTTQEAAHREIHHRRAHLERTLPGCQLGRPWMHSEEEWTSAAPPQGNRLILPQLSKHAQDPLSEPAEVPVNGDTEQACALCKEPLRATWSDLKEAWVFKDALLVRATQGHREICHRRCIT